MEPFVRSGANRVEFGATFELSRGGDRLGTLRPRLNDYDNQVQAIPTPAVRTGLREDVYLSLVRIDGDTSTITVDAYRFPLVWMVWAGGLLLFTGGVWSFAGRKLRAQSREAAGV